MLFIEFCLFDFFIERGQPDGAPSSSSLSAPGPAPASTGSIPRRRTTSTNSGSSTPTYAAPTASSLRRGAGTVKRRTLNFNELFFFCHVNYLDFVFQVSGPRHQTIEIKWLQQLQHRLQLRCKPPADRPQHRNIELNGLLVVWWPAEGFGNEPEARHISTRSTR